MRDIPFLLPVLENMPARKPKATRTLGIIGGGQLAKMLAQSASQFGCETVILERNSHSPASTVAAKTVFGDWDNPDALLALGAQVDAVTLENEFVDADSLSALKRFGHPVWPSADTIRLVQDKLLQKQALADAGLPVPSFLAAPNKASILSAAEELQWPLLLKKRRNGYDGKGNYTVRNADEIETAWTFLDGERNALYIEQFCPFACELAIMLTRGQLGEIAVYPVVETVQKNHVCNLVKAPAAILPDTAARVVEIAKKAVEAVNTVGTMGVELFLLKDGTILINELAPRVHNSGHYTIEGCVCSQFENHVRAVLGLPLGSTAMTSPFAVMVNLLGSAKGSGRPQGLEKALAIAGAHPHIYGKALSAAGRKMGHVTALGKTMNEALAIAEHAASLIYFGGEL